MHPKLVIGTSLLLLVLVSACQKNRVSKRGALGLNNGDQNSGDQQSNQAPIEPAANEEGKGLSLANSVRFKKQALIKNDLESALGLTSPEICKELGASDCLSEVHHLALGGVDAYKRGVFAGISESMITSPIALERVALAGCSERARRDLKAGENEIFQGMSLDPAGNVSAEGREASLGAAVTTLFARFLGREPSAYEVGALVDMYEDVAKETSSNQSFEWARLSCYTVATDLECVFY